MADGLCVCVGKWAGGRRYELAVFTCVHLFDVCACVRALQLDASCLSCCSSPDILLAVFIQSAGSSFHLHTDTHGERILFPCDVIDSELHGNSEREAREGREKENGQIFLHSA